MKYHSTSNVNYFNLGYMASQVHLQYLQSFATESSAISNKNTGNTPAIFMSFIGSCILPLYGAIMKTQMSYQSLCHIIHIILNTVCVRVVLSMPMAYRFRLPF